MDNLVQKFQETLHRISDQMRSNVKPKTDHGQQATRDTEAKIKQKLDGS